MREILFRGITEYGYMVYGSLIVAGKYCCILEREEDVHPMDYPYLNSLMGTFDGKATPVKPETVSQWTGLVDKNGMKIFEGDVVKYEKLDCSVRWNITHGSYTLLYSDPVLGLAYFHLYEDESSHMEVVGNIWDNPDLVE